MKSGYKIFLCVLLSIGSVFAAKDCRTAEGNGLCQIEARGKICDDPCGCPPYWHDPGDACTNKWQCFYKSCCGQKTSGCNQMLNNDEIEKANSELVE